MLTRWHGCTLFTEWQEHIFETFLVVPPSVALQDQGPLCAIGHNEAVNGMVNLNENTMF